MKLYRTFGYTLCSGAGPRAIIVTGDETRTTINLVTCVTCEFSNISECARTRRNKVSVVIRRQCPAACWWRGKQWYLLNRQNKPNHWLWILTSLILCRTRDYQRRLAFIISKTSALWFSTSPRVYDRFFVINILQFYPDVHVLEINVPHVHLYYITM